MKFFSRFVPSRFRSVDLPAENAVGIREIVWDGPVYVIGDVHGCLSLYRKLEECISADASKFSEEHTIVLLGDVVDRGPDTAQLLDYLINQRQQNGRTLCLMGNHEEMMLSFLAAPSTTSDWLRHGGVETLASYGLSLDDEVLKRFTRRQLVQQIASHIPDSHVGYLRDCLPGLKIGPYLLVHAGVDADLPLVSQRTSALYWGAAGQNPQSGMTLVYGHFINKTPKFASDSIGIDTGAYATGRLTCLRLVRDQLPALMTTGVHENFNVINKGEL